MQLSDEIKKKISKENFELINKSESVAHKFNNLLNNANISMYQIQFQHSKQYDKDIHLIDNEDFDFFNRRSIISTIIMPQFMTIKSRYGKTIHLDTNNNHYNIINMDNINQLRTVDKIWYLQEILDFTKNDININYQKLFSKYNYSANQHQNSLVENITLFNSNVRYDLTKFINSYDICLLQINENIL